MLKSPVIKPDVISGAFHADLKDRGFAWHNDTLFFTVGGAAILLAESIPNSGDEYSIGWLAATTIRDDIKRYVQEGVISQYSRESLGELPINVYSESALLTEDGVRTLAIAKYPSTKLIDVQTFAMAMSFDLEDLKVKALVKTSADTDTKDKNKRCRQVFALIDAIEGMGLDPAALVVGDGEKRGIHKKCLELYGGKGLFTASFATFNGVWRDAANGKCSKKIVVISKRGR